MPVDGRKISVYYLLSVSGYGEFPPPLSARSHLSGPKKATRRYGVRENLKQRCILETDFPQIRQDRQSRPKWTIP